MNLFLYTKNLTSVSYNLLKPARYLDELFRFATGFHKNVMLKPTLFSTNLPFNINIIKIDYSEWSVADTTSCQFRQY
jgi:hypothetical protein